MSVLPKRIASVQSNYIPWKGYFDMIASVDEFVLLDEVQYTRRDWRNRNRIKTANGAQWMSVPVQAKGRYDQRIDETLVQDPTWAGNHWQTLRHTYAKASCFHDVEPAIRSLYEQVAGYERLSDVNRTMLSGICEQLGIDTPLTWSTDYETRGDKTERLVTLCVSAGATTYVSGPAAKAYLDEAAFAAEGITVEFFSYGPYADYEQLHGAFLPGVTVLDVLFNAGPHRARDLVRPMSAARTPNHEMETT